MDAKTKRNFLIVLSYYWPLDIPPDQTLKSPESFHHRHGHEFNEPARFPSVVFVSATAIGGLTALVWWTKQKNKEIHSAAVDLFSLGSLHEPIAWLQSRIPLGHPPFATLTIVATAVGNRQFGMTHNVSCPAIRAAKVNAMAELAAHRCII